MRLVLARERLRRLRTLMSLRKKSLFWDFGKISRNRKCLNLVSAIRCNAFMRDKFFDIFHRIRQGDFFRSLLIRAP